MTLDDTDIKSVCSVLEVVDTGTVDSLNLEGCNLKEHQVAEISPLLEKARVVNISSNPLSGFPLKSISDQLKVSTGVDNLMLRHIHLTKAEQDGASLAACFMHSSLTAMTLRGCKLDNVRLASLAENISLCSHLKVLSLGQCCLGYGCGTDLARLMTHLPNLQLVFLDDIGLGDDDLEKVLSALSVNRSIAKCDFTENQLSDTISDHLLRFFRSRRSQEPEHSAGVEAATPSSQPTQCEILLSGNPGVTLALLEKLAQSGVCGNDAVLFSCWSVTSTSVIRKSVRTLVSKHGGTLYGFVPGESMAELGEFLVTDTTVKKLHLSYNQLTDIGVRCMVMHGPSQYQYIRYLNLIGNNIHLSGAAVLVDAFRNSALLALSLSRNPLFEDADTRSAEYALFFSSLAELKHLKCIMLQRTGANISIAEKLFDILRSLSIVLLNLGENQLGDDVTTLLVSLQECNHSMEIIDLEKNSVTDSGVTVLTSCPAVMDMERVLLSGNPIAEQVVPRPLLLAKHSYSFGFMEAIAGE